MIAVTELRQLTRRQRELAERPFCVKCGVKVVRNTSELINGQLWCLKCHGVKPKKPNPCQSPKSTKRRSKRGWKLKLTIKRRRLFKADPRCRYCGCDLTWHTATLDHVVPRSKGGRDSMDNLVLACQPCNVQKADKLLGEGGDQPLQTKDCQLVSIIDEQNSPTEMRSATPER
jgi:5-methylcytosine-specific restriction endonuclease McrA